jgi:hypothetical protein
VLTYCGGIFRGEAARGGDMSYVGAPDPSMTPKEEEFLLLYGPRKERKALKKRRKAEREALKKQSKS